jgi:hypothetical protein
MKKMVLLILMLLCLPALAEDEGSWNSLPLDLPEAKPVVTDEQFQKALDSKLKRKPPKNKNIPKGKVNSKGFDETSFVEEVEDDLPVIPIATNLIIGNRVLPSGHYQIKGEMLNGSPVLKFYQSHHLIAQLPVIEIDHDFGEKNINFVKLIDHEPAQVKLIFGNMDFNAYRILDVAEGK